MPDLLKGWFCDRATGRGKPVYSSGSIIVPTNGIVGGGVSSGGVAPTFANGVPAPGPAVELLDGWFCDRSPGQGKNTFSGLGSANGPWGICTNGIAPPPGAGGKYY